MIKPLKLTSGDKIAIVSLSWGGLGDKEQSQNIHGIFGYNSIPFYDEQSRHSILLWPVYNG